jgi:hypothetical protein
MRNSENSETPLNDHTLSTFPSLKMPKSASSFSFNKMVSTAEWVYEVNNTVFPILTNVLMMVAITVVLPVPGIPKIKE